MAWEPNGKRLATASEDQTIKLWNARTGEQLSTIRGHTDIVTAITWSPDGRRWISGGEDSVRIWDPDRPDLYTPRVLRAKGRGVAWSPDGTRLAAGR